MRFPESSTRDVTTRLRRLEGQIRGIQRLVDEGADCRAIVTQLAAAKGALDRVAYKLVVSAMHECVVNDDGDPDELERLFLKLT